jgi:hypothetical protein
MTSRFDEFQNVFNQQKISDFTPTKIKLTEFKEDITKLLVGTSNAPFLLENEFFLRLLQEIFTNL